MDMNKKIKATGQALLAACLYALNIPLSKVFLQAAGPMTMAGFLYLGAGLGIGLLYLVYDKNKEDSLSREDLPYTLGMVVLDILAPIFLMMGLVWTSSANASLLNNFEIVATSVIAWILFGEKISGLLGLAIILMTLASGILSFEGAQSLEFSKGSILVLLAGLSWGFENNCTRKIAHKNTFEIVMIKGIFSGLGSIAIALVAGETLPDLSNLCKIMVLGFLAYGLSIFFYIRAQEVIGAAKTSAWYSVAPFVAVLLSVVFLKEGLSWKFLLALAIMVLASILVVADTLKKAHDHSHSHVIYSYSHGHIIKKTLVHSHSHQHYLGGGYHDHLHKKR